MNSKSAFTMELSAYIQDLLDYIMNDLKPTDQISDFESARMYLFDTFNDPKIAERFKYKGGNLRITQMRELDSAAETLLKYCNNVLSLDNDTDEISVQNSSEEEAEEVVAPKKETIMSAKMQQMLKSSPEKTDTAKTIPRKSKEKAPVEHASDRRKREHIESCNFVDASPVDLASIGRDKSAKNAFMRLLTKHMDVELTDEPGEVTNKCADAHGCKIEEASLKSNHLAIKYSYVDGEDKRHTISANYGAANPSRKPPKGIKKVVIDHIDLEDQFIETFNAYAKESKILNPFENLKLLNSDYIYDLKRMEIIPADEHSSKPIVDYLNNVVLNDYKIGYPVTESMAYIYRKRDYPRLFDLLRIPTAFNGTLNKQIMWQIYQHRSAIIYHDSYAARINEYWNSSLKTLTACAKDYDAKTVNLWKSILSSKQCFNIICKGYPATVAFEKGLKSLIQDINTLKLMLGPLFMISPIFSPYGIYCSDMIVTGKNSDRPLKFNTGFITKLIRHVTIESDDALDYSTCIWAEGLNHLEQFDMKKLPDRNDLHSFRCIVTEAILKTKKERGM